MPQDNTRPLIYSCSGCSNVAQLANHVAVRLDRQGLAEMSCIAGVGGGVKSLVRKARQAHTIIAIDGCPLACAKACLANAGVAPDHYVQLSQWHFRKRYGEDCSAQEVQWVTERIAREFCGKSGSAPDSCSPADS